MARNSQRQLGDKLGPKLAAIMTEATVAARAKMVPHEAKIHQAATQALIDRAGHEIADLYAPLVMPILQHPKTPEHIRDHIAKAASGQHQWQAVAGFAFGSSGIPSVISTVVGNQLAPVTYELVGSNPHLIPDINTLVAMRVKGIMQENDVFVDGGKQGYDTGWVNRLSDLALSWPDMTTVIELGRRRMLGHDEGPYILNRLGIPRQFWDRIMQLIGTPLPPADLADMVVRGIKDQKAAAYEAYESGVSEEQFNYMVLDTGEPPSLTDLAMAYRRNIIDKARFVHGIRQSRVRDEWVDVLEKVQFAPISVADAITAYIQGHLSETQAREVANLNGLMPQYFDTLAQSYGEPISKTEVIELLRRGKISKERAIQAIKESRIKDKYIPDILELERNLIPPREISTLYSHGALTEDQAKTLLKDYGYDDVIQKAFLYSAVHGKVSSLKQITLAQVSRLYVEGIISWQEGTKLLKETGYQNLELSYVKEILDGQRVYRNREAAINKIRSLYIAYHINRQVASGQIDALGVLANERDKLISLWNIERTSNAKQLTKAEIVDAAEYQLITWQESVNLLVEIGYSRDKAILIAEIKAKGPIAGIH